LKDQAQAQRINEMRSRGIRADFLSLQKQEKYVQTSKVRRMMEALSDEHTDASSEDGRLMFTGKNGSIVAVLQIQERTPSGIVETTEENLCLVLTEVARPVDTGETEEGERELKWRNGDIVGAKKRVADATTVSVHSGDKGLKWRAVWDRKEVEKVLSRVEDRFTN
jgi:hypothetical protein